MRNLTMPSSSPPLKSRPRVSLGGLLGAALAASHAGRLSNFIVDENSPAIALFRPDAVNHNLEGDWYGEHAGKWLYAASKSAARTGNTKMATSVTRVADFLISVQGGDGYLGTYAPEARFMRKQPPALRTWNGAPSRRTWDIWNHTCLILGLLEVNRHFPNIKYLEAARRIGDLCWNTLSAGEINITELGLHHGLSSTVMLDAAVELHVATGEQQYLNLATLILEQADANPDLRLLENALAGIDASEISTGKAYQLCWNMVGLAKLFGVTGNTQFLAAAKNIWESIRNNHLTLGGGPWGGVGLRSREVFNPPSVFSPNGYVETCSTLAWIQLNRELLAITGDAVYAEEIERSAYNDLLGAAAPNGEDWCYYSFPNGKRVYTTYWRCCKSSGAMALEELPGIAYSVSAHQELSVNLYCAGKAELQTSDGTLVRLEQFTNYPFGETIRIAVDPERRSSFKIKLRIPSWSKNVTILINGIEWPNDSAAGHYAVVDREWISGDTIELQLPMQPQITRKASVSVQESAGPDRAPIKQEVMHVDYIAITRGPLVYATSLIDGFKTQETVRIPSDEANELLEVIEAPDGLGAPSIHLKLACRPPLVFHPYYEAGGRTDGAWRLTWMQVSPESPGEL